MNYQNWEPVSNPKSKAKAQLKSVNQAGCPGGPLPGAAVCRIYGSILQESLGHRVALVLLLFHLRPWLFLCLPRYSLDHSWALPTGPLPPCNVFHGSFQIPAAFWPLNLLSIDCMGFITFYWLLMLLVLWSNANFSINLYHMWIIQGKKHSFSPFYRFCSFPSGEHHDPYEIRKRVCQIILICSQADNAALASHWHHYRTVTQEVGCCPQERGIRQGWDSPESLSKPSAL